MAREKPDTGTPEFIKRHRGNIEWLGGDRTVHKRTKIRHPSRASFLHGRHVITENEKELAERVMNLYVICRRTLRGMQLMDESRGLPLNEGITAEDQLYSLVRRLGSYWPTMHFEFLEELMPGVEHYRTSIPNRIQLGNIKAALDKADAFFYEWSKPEQEDISFQEFLSTFTTTLTRESV